MKSRIDSTGFTQHGNHTTDQEVFNKTLGSRGVKKASYANRAVAVPNELDDIIRAIQLYS